MQKTEEGMTEKEIYKKVIMKRGTELQFNLTIEALAELIKAISQFVRKGGTAFTITEEVASVEVMCGQLRVILGDDLVELRKKQRIEGLKALIGK